MARAKAPAQSKQEMRSETDRLIKEAMERKNLTVTQGKTRIDTKCGKCGAPQRVMVEAGEKRVSFTCKECSHSQLSL